MKLIVTFIDADVSIVDEDEPPSNMLPANVFL